LHQRQGVVVVQVGDTGEGDGRHGRGQGERIARVAVEVSEQYRAVRVRAVDAVRDHVHERAFTVVGPLPRAALCVGQGPGYVDVALVAEQGEGGVAEGEARVERDRPAEGVLGAGPDLEDAVETGAVGGGCLGVRGQREPVPVKGTAAGGAWRGGERGEQVPGE